MGIVGIDIGCMLQIDIKLACEEDTSILTFPIEYLSK